MSSDVANESSTIGEVVVKSEPLQIDHSVEQQSCTDVDSAVSRDVETKCPDLKMTQSNQKTDKSCEDQSTEFVVKLRGLPWSATREELLGFLGGCNVNNGVEGIHLVSRHGPIRGEAYVELEAENDVELALTRHRQHMGTRYIEVFRSSASEMNNVLNPKVGVNWRDPVVRLRGIPYYCTKDEIYDFFSVYTGPFLFSFGYSELQIARNGVYMSMDEAGNANGLAFVAFTKMDFAQRALEKHRLMIGHRYVEVFQSSYAEARAKMLEEIEQNGRSPLRRRSPIEREPYEQRHMSFDDYEPYTAPLHVRYASPGPMRSLPHVLLSQRAPPDMMCHGSPYPMRRGANHISPCLPRVIQMLGLPFTSSLADIREFFKPIRTVHIHMHQDARGRPAGTASVEFGSHEEAMEAMKKDKEYIGSRYIDLSLHNAPFSHLPRGRNMARAQENLYDESGFGSHMRPGEGYRPEMF